MPRLSALVLAAVLLAGCGSTRYPSDMEMRLGSDVPDQFRFERPLDRENCQSPAIDPADGTRLALERSRDGRGDYAVTPGRYGAQADELLRISCATGRPIGLVPR